MVFFFGLAAKEVYEAMLPGGPLSSPREGAVPVFAAVGGMAAPASIYLAAIWFLGRPDLHSGWAIPCATDIAFSYLVSRAIFKPGHPAIPFLLLLAIADDALGLIVLAIFYPSGAVSMQLLMGLLAAGHRVAWALRFFGVGNFWATSSARSARLARIVLAACTGARARADHSADAARQHDLRVFGKTELVRLKTLHHFETWWKIPGSSSCSRSIRECGCPSLGRAHLVDRAASLLVGSRSASSRRHDAERSGFRRAAGLDYRSPVTLGVAAGIGFTVALFFTTAAFPPGAIQSQAKMGALFSFFGGGLAIVVGRALGLKNK
jgi:NhaA family Na+:H+ antiporter